MGKGNNRFPLTYVGNITKAAVASLEVEQALGQVYIITDGESHTMNEIVYVISRALGINYTGHHLPLYPTMALVKFVELIFSIFGKTPPLTVSAIEYLTSDRVFSIEKAKRELNYKPISLREGINQTINWHRQNNYLK